MLLKNHETSAPFATYHAEYPAILAVDDGPVSPEDGDLEAPAHEGEEDLEDVEAQLDAGNHLRIPFEIFKHFQQLFLSRAEFLLLCWPVVLLVVVVVSPVRSGTGSQRGKCCRSRNYIRGGMG